MVSREVEATFTEPVRLAQHRYLSSRQAGIMFQVVTTGRATLLLQRSLFHLAMSGALAVCIRQTPGAHIVEAFFESTATLSIVATPFSKGPTGYLQGMSIAIVTGVLRPRLNSRAS